MAEICFLKSIFDIVHLCQLQNQRKKQSVDLFARGLLMIAKRRNERYYKKIEKKSKIDTKEAAKMLSSAYSIIDKAAKRVLSKK